MIETIRIKNYTKITQLEKNPLILYMIFYIYNVMLIIGLYDV